MVDEVKIYGEEEQLWQNVKENAEIAIKQAEGSLTINKELIKLAEKKINVARRKEETKTEQNS